jgi:hypothetical protein
VTGLVKHRLLGCMGQILQWGLWHGKEPEMRQGGRGTRLVLTRSLQRLGGWQKVIERERKKIANGGIRKEKMVTFFENVPQRMKTKVVGGD